jgi:hypothetical protein
MWQYFEAAVFFLRSNNASVNRLLGNYCFRLTFRYCSLKRFGPGPGAGSVQTPVQYTAWEGRGGGRAGECTCICIITSEYQQKFTTPPAFCSVQVVTVQPSEAFMGNPRNTAVIRFSTYIPIVLVTFSAYSK